MFPKINKKEASKDSKKSKKGSTVIPPQGNRSNGKKQKQKASTWNTR